MRDIIYVDCVRGIHQDADACACADTRTNQLVRIRFSQLEDLNKEQRKVYAWTGGRLWKAKFCLAAQGHQGPDLLLKVESGKLNSPTVQ